MGNNLTGQTIASTYGNLVQISGSRLTNGTGSEITNLTITASNAGIAISAETAQNAVSSSYAVNAVNAENATSASYATTASFALNAGTTVDTGSLLTTASISDATITFTKGDASTFNIVVNNVSNASTASIADAATSASYALTASYALNGGGGSQNLQQVTDLGATTTNTIQVSGSAGVIDLGATDLTYTSGDDVTAQTIFFQNSGFSNTANITFDPSSGDLTIGADGVAQFNGNASTADSATSASYALTASYVEGGGGATPNLQQVTTEGATTTNSIVVSGSEGTITTDNYDINFTSGDDTTAQTITWNNSGFTNTANITFDPSSGDLTIGADGTAQFNGNASTADNATSASYALSASHAETANSAASATTATSASYATTASHALGLADGLNLNVANLTASGILTTNLTATSASIGFLQTVTGSSTIIGDAFILLNTSDATRYAGLLVEDSGSGTPVNYTASWFFDSQLNDWNYEYSTTASTDYGVALFGPTYTTKGTPTYLTANTIPKAEGTHHLVDSAISDDGTTITLGQDTTLYKAGAATLIVTNDDDYSGASTLTIGGGPGGAGDPVTISNFAGVGYMLATNGFSVSSDIVSSNKIVAPSFTGSLNGNADTATTASYALTASYVAGGATVPTLQQVTTVGNSTSQSIEITGLEGSVTFDNYEVGFVSANDSTIMGWNFNNSTFTNVSTLSFNPANGNLTISADGDLTLNSNGTAQFNGNASTADTATSASYASTADAATSASYALTASYALNGGGGGGSQNLQEVTTIGASTSASIVMGDGIVAYNTINGNGSGFSIQSSDDTTDLTLAFADSIGISTGEVRFAPTTGLLSMYSDNGIEIQSSTTFTAPNVGVNNGTFSGTLVDNLIPTASISQTQVQHIVTLDEPTWLSISGSGNLQSDTMYVLVDSGSGQYIEGALSSNVNNLSIVSNTASMDCSAANFFTLLLGSGATTHLVASNLTAGQTINLQLVQPSPTGSLTFSSNIMFPGGTAFEPSATANAIDVMTFVSFDGSYLQANGVKDFS